MSRSAEAIREVDRAVELDPLCLIVATSAAAVHYFAGDYDGALDRCSRTLDLDPEYLPAQRLMGAAYLQAGRTQDALDAFYPDGTPIVLNSRQSYHVEKLSYQMTPNNKIIVSGSITWTQPYSTWSMRIRGRVHRSQIWT